MKNLATSLRAQTSSSLFLLFWYYLTSIVLHRNRPPCLGLGAGITNRPRRAARAASTVGPGLPRLASSSPDYRAHRTVLPSGCHDLAAVFTRPRISWIAAGLPCFVSEPHRRRVDTVVDVLLMDDTPCMYIRACWLAVSSVKAT
jgi:hypothetical protein